MKVVFFGTPQYVVPILNSLNKYHKIVRVITQGPKPVGREKRMTYSPVDQWAYEKNISKTFDLKDIPEADLGVCAAYGNIIPQAVIDKFKYGILNIHPSLLPKYRGASPIQGAIANGDTQTGVTVIKMDSKMDHGPIVSYFKETINLNDTTESLRTRLFERTADFLINLIPSYIDGKIIPKEQNHDEATFTKVISKDDGKIDLARSTPIEAERLIRAMTPWPGAWTEIKAKDGKLTKRLKLLKAHVEEGKLILDEVQLEGKNPVKWKQFESAYGSQFSLAF